MCHERYITFMSRILYHLYATNSISPPCIIAWASMSRTLYHRPVLVRGPLCHELYITFISRTLYQIAHDRVGFGYYDVGTYICKSVQHTYIYINTHMCKFIYVYMYK